MPRGKANPNPAGHKAGKGNGESTETETTTETTTSADAHQLSNVAAINDEIGEAFKAILADEDYKDELEAEHIAPVKDSIKERWQTLKARTDMELEELKLLYKIYKRQERAKKFEKEEDRARVADNFRTAFKALVSGQMLDFLDVLGAEHVPAAVRNAEQMQAANDAEEDAERRVH